MGEVDEHAALLHATHQRAAQVGEAALLCAVRRAGELVVEEMCEADHAKAAVEEDVEVREVTLQRVRALDPEQRADRPAARRAPSQQRLELRARAHRHQRSVRALDGFLQAIGLELRASQRTAPGERARAAPVRAA